MIALFGYLGGPFGLSGLKQICSGTGNAALGFPRASGLLILNDPATNRPFALMDAAAISAARTAAVSGLALRLLASDAARSIAVIGCGELAHAHLAMLAAVFGADRFGLVAYDPDAGRLAALTAAAQALGIVCMPAGSVEAAAREGDIVLPATTAEAPHIRREWLRDNALYCAVSLLDAELDIYRAARLIMVDDLHQCLAEGRPLDRLQRAGQIDRARIVEIGAWLASPGYLTGDAAPVVFNPMGTVITDLAAGLAVFEAAVGADLGTRLPL
jgi:ornithine cyclodeaminase